MDRHVPTKNDQAYNYWSHIDVVPAISRRQCCEQHDSFIHHAGLIDDILAYLLLAHPL